MQPKFKIPRARTLYPIPALWNGRSETDPSTREIHGAGIREIWQHVKGKQFSSFYLEKEWEDVGLKIASRLINEPHYLKDIYKTQKNAGEKLVEYSHKIINEDLSKHPLSELFKIYQNIEDLWVKHDQYNVSPWFIGGDYFHNHTVKALKENGLSEDEIATVLIPRRPSFSADEELALINTTLLVLKFKSKEKPLETIFAMKDVLNKIDDLVNKYFWIPFGYDGLILYDRAHYIKAITDLIASKNEQNLKEKKDQIESYEADMSRKQEIIAKKYNISEQVISLCETVHVLAQMTDQRKEFTFQSFVAFDCVVKELADRLKLERDEIKHLMLGELKSNTENPKVLHEVAEKRINSEIVLYWKDGACEVWETGKAKKFFQDSMPVQNNDVIKGQTGCRGSQGKVTGRVKVLFTSSEMGKLEQGEVLVSPMTTPEFVPAMRRSLAIVTDEGGITCHAAIVSRELNIPCIIGTKNATKVLKDGDMVEVDADNGVVRIITKA